MTPEAYTILFNDYYSRLCYYAESIIHQREEAQDIVMEVFKNLLEYADVDRNILYASVKNGCCNLIKHRRYIHGYERSLTEKSEESVEQKVIDAELIHLIYGKIYLLPERCRLIFEMSYIDGIRTKDIAAQLGISISNVSEQKNRAVKLLKHLCI